MRVDLFWISGRQVILLEGLIEIQIIKFASLLHMATQVIDYFSTTVKDIAFEIN